MFDSAQWAIRQVQRRFELLRNEARACRISANSASYRKVIPAMNILLVYPRNPDTFWSFKHVLKFVSKKCAFPPLGLLTVAAMLPRDWNLRLVDLNVSALTDDQICEADYVFLSGMIVHKQSAHEIAARCAALGKAVVAGGPLFTTGHREFPEIAHFVLGEAEEVIEQLVADMRQRHVAACLPRSGLAEPGQDAGSALGPD